MKHIMELIHLMMSSERKYMMTRLASLSRYPVVNTIMIPIGGFILIMTWKKNEDLILWKTFSHPVSFLFRFKKVTRSALLFQQVIHRIGMLSNYWPRKVYAGNH